MKLWVMSVLNTDIATEPTEIANVARVSSHGGYVHGGEYFIYAVTVHCYPSLTNVAKCDPTVVMSFLGIWQRLGDGFLSVLVARHGLRGLWCAHIYTGFLGSIGFVEGIRVVLLLLVGGSYK